MKNVATITFLYAFLFFCAIFLLVVYKLLLKEKVEKIGYIVLMAIAIVNFGYFLLSCSKNVATAILANRLSYLGSVVLLSGMYMIVNEFCNVKANKALSLTINLISILALLLALSGGSKIKLYYQSVDIRIVNNITQLVKEYGPLHYLYSVYVFTMFIVTLVTVIKSIIKKRVISSVNPIILLLLVTENMMVWYIERMLLVEMELLSFSYITTGAIFILIFKNNYDYKKLNNINNKNIDEVINSWKVQYKLTNRELEITKYLIDNVPRNDIAKQLFLSEHTVKKHTTHIYEKLHITSRNDLLHKLNQELAN